MRPFISRKTLLSIATAAILAMATIDARAADEARPAAIGDKNIPRLEVTVSSDAVQHSCSGATFQACGTWRVEKKVENAILLKAKSPSTLVFLKLSQNGWPDAMENSDAASEKLLNYTVRTFMEDAPDIKCVEKGLIRVNDQTVARVTFSVPEDGKLTYFTQYVFHTRKTVAVLSYVSPQASHETLRQDVEQMVSTLKIP